MRNRIGQYVRNVNYCAKIAENSQEIINYRVKHKRNVQNHTNVQKYSHRKFGGYVISIRYFSIKRLYLFPWQQIELFRFDYARPFDFNDY